MVPKVETFEQHAHIVSAKRALDFGAFVSFVNLEETVAAEGMSACRGDFELFGLSEADGASVVVPLSAKFFAVMGLFQGDFWDCDLVEVKLFDIVPVVNDDERDGGDHEEYGNNNLVSDCLHCDEYSTWFTIKD